MSTTNLAAQAFAKNRAEELGFDLWGEFVVPLYYDRLALDEVRKPLIFEGGRGCGKTTLLRYLSHATQLSPNRELTQQTLPKQIGLYLRADTQHLRTFRGEALSEDDWHRAFEHDLCLSIATELLSALQLLSSNAQRRQSFPGVDALDFTAWRDFDATAPTTLSALTRHIRSARNRFSMWLNNQDGDQPRPTFLPLRPALLELINVVLEQLDFMRDRVFFVFIDEYENLLEYQMRAVNTRLKHSEAPLIFHIATKRNGMVTRQTLSAEQLQERDDFRTCDIEEWAETDFPLFAAELFCSRLRRKGIDVGSQAIEPETLLSLTGIKARLDNQAYRRETLEAARKILPGLSNENAARHVLQDKGLRGRLRDNIATGLKLSDAAHQPDDFIREDLAQEALCVPALLHQGKKPKDLLVELDKKAEKKTNQFDTAYWTHNYFSASMYLLFLPLPTPCVLYAGFDAFLKLSKGNTRHFLELCHLSLQGTDVIDGQVQSVDIKNQAMAARDASALFVKETQGSGDFGNRLFHVVNTLGQVFRLSHARPSQSEAERTHFAISGGDLKPDAQKLLSECLKWSVLFVAPETKVKGARLETMDYIFNPIYAPYFGISFNKGRKLELPASAVETLMTGRHEEMNALVKSYQKAWKLDGDGDQYSLFSQA